MVFGQRTTPTLWRRQGVPRAHKDRHWCHYEANKHWIEWVDDGLSERADVGPAKKRKLLPASLR